ncbi:MAG: NAD(P)-dependent alcohol dehydrogenase [Pseudomonadota bacterium]
MKTRNKILGGVAAVLLVGIAALMMGLSHDSTCPTAPESTDADSMHAIMHRCYGPPSLLTLERIAKPRPADDEVLIKIHAASVNPYEMHMATGKPYVMRLSTGFGAPERVRLGHDFAGTIESVGAKVTRFKPGDDVFGFVGAALAEYAVSKETGDIVLKPAELPFEDAAALGIAGGTALNAVRDYGRIKAGQKVLINGASGGVGTYAVQLAKNYGAEVTAVCSTRNVELVRSLGADHVIDYTRQNFTEASEQYDVIIDNVGNQDFLDLRRVVKPKGIIVTVSGPKDNPWFGPMTRVMKQKMLAPFVSQELVFFIADAGATDLEYLAGLIRDGKMKSVIDRRYPLAQTAAALEYVGTGHARGKVIVTVD